MLILRRLPRRAAASSGQVFLNEQPLAGRIKGPVLPCWRVQGDRCPNHAIITPIPHRRAIRPYWDRCGTTWGSLATCPSACTPTEKELRAVSPPTGRLTRGFGFSLARFWWPGTLRLERQIKAHGPVNYCLLCPPVTVLAPPPLPG
jgi:hypothetical protein